MKNKNSLIIIGIGVLVLLAIIILIMVIALRKPNNSENNNDFVEYETELLKIDFSKYVTKSSGEISKKEGYEDYATLVFEIKEDEVEELKNDLNNHMDVYTERYNANAAEDHPMNLVKQVTEDLNGKEIVEVYKKALTGEKVKTRIIHVFLCKDSNNYYLYIYG